MIGRGGVEKKSSRPHRPMPPHIFAWLRMPTWRISILARNSLTSFFTSSRKSTRPSAVKKKVSLLASKVLSTENRFILSLDFLMHFWQNLYARASRSIFFFRRRWSLSLATRKTFLNAFPRGGASIGVGGRATVPNPSPFSVSTMTFSPCLSTNAPQSK